MGCQTSWWSVAHILLVIKCTWDLSKIIKLFFPSHASHPNCISAFCQALVQVSPNTQTHRHGLLRTLPETGFSFLSADLVGSVWLKVCNTPLHKHKFEVMSSKISGSKNHVFIFEIVSSLACVYLHWFISNLSTELLIKHLSRASITLKDNFNHNVQRNIQYQSTVGTPSRSMFYFQHRSLTLKTSKLLCSKQKMKPTRMYFTFQIFNISAQLYKCSSADILQSDHSQMIGFYSNLRT